MELHPLKRFKAPILSKRDLEEAANKIRNQHASLAKVPIDVLAFAEFDLSLEFEFAPIQHLNQDAFLRPDRTGILFNSATFKIPQYKPRIRFSAAHELGHFFLHEEVYGKLQFSSVDDWIKFIGAIPIVEYQWMEFHADEFAGQLLMPSKELQGALEETINDSEKEGLFKLGKEFIFNHCCQAMKPYFEVSLPAMQTRLRNSVFWPHPKIAQLSN